MRLLICLMLLAGFGLAGGCAGRPALLPNADPNLRKTSAEFAADAAKRFPYPADAPRGGEAVARAQAGYAFNVLEVVNLSDEDWQDVEVWVNESYVVFIPVMQKGVLKTMQFQMLFNDKGVYFPIDNSKVMVNKVELYRNGTMYDVRVVAAD